MFYRRHPGKILGAGLIGLAIGTAVGVLLAPKSGKETRDDLADWMNRMERELRRRVHNSQNMSHEKYDQVVDELKNKYRKLKYIKENELDDFSEDLKKRWERIKDEWNDIN